MPDPVVMRYRPPHFVRLFSGGYASGYYCYMWSEVLEAADGFRAFEHTGDPFEPALARRLKGHVYVAGNNTAPQETYRAFRGRDADPRVLIEKRGLAPAA